jgi:lipopolysaccharide/colanic/teichoic acid biosynthesis glycosyltransferase
VNNRSNDFAAENSTAATPTGGISNPEYAATTLDTAGQSMRYVNPSAFNDELVPGRSPLLHPWSQFCKRVVDIVISLPIVIFMLPMLCVVVKTIQWMQSSGPLFYRQVRCGRGDHQFLIWKFRTMHVPVDGASDIDENLESRIFPLGQFLRNAKIDEIPQFGNVLLGTMSVVGPRPHHFEDCKKFEGVVDDYPLRSIAKPGITGLAQYREYRGAFAWNCVQSRVERDLKYINLWSQWLDFSLIAKTAFAVVFKVVSSPFTSTTLESTVAQELRPELRIFTDLSDGDPEAVSSGIDENRAGQTEAVDRDDLAA